MQYQDIYNLSKSFGPPKISLRDGQILDDYGSEKFSKLPIDHKSPDDVKLEEIEYYGWVYPFLEPRDLIFYLYPLLVEFQKDMSLDCFDSFMYSMDRELEGLLESLSSEQVATLKSAFELVWNLGGDDGSDWFGCPNLQKFIGITVK
ncbi:MAG: hypothetical protein AB8B81_14345 [Halioglobus sp.]